MGYQSCSDKGCVTLLSTVMYTPLVMYDARFDIFE